MWVRSPPSALYFRVAGLPDFTHAAFADLRGDLVDAEPGAGAECHVRFRESLDYIGKPVVGAQGSRVAVMRPGWRPTGRSRFLRLPASRSNLDR